MQPILFEFGIITVFYLWFLIAIGYVVGTFITIDIAKRNRIRLDAFVDNGLPLFFWTLIVARVFFVAFHPEFYFSQFSPGSLFNIFAIWDKGLSFWGAMAGLISGLWYFCRKEMLPGESFAKMLDALIPGLLIGMFFGNIGAFMDGINYGSPTNMPWGIAFRSANVKYITPIHPTQLYAALYCLILGLTLLSIVKKKRGTAAGFTTELCITLLSFFKFLEEFLRGDEAIKIVFIRLPQIVAFFGLLIGIWLLSKRLRKSTDHKSNPAETVQNPLHA